VKSPGVIYRKYRQVKRKYLFNKVSESYRKDHENCSYGHSVEYKDTNNRERNAKLCMCGVDGPGKQVKDFRCIDICTNAASCNAFAPKRNRDEVSAEFEDFDICSAKYPEIAAYMWVLDKDLETAKKNISPITKLIISLIDLLESTLKLVDTRTKIEP